jgi:hypothetical protein
MSVGVLMLGQWSFFILSGNVVEFNTTPIEISFHISIEVLTALVLLITGYRLLKDRNNSIKWNILAQGMLIYTVVNSSGYFAQLGQWPFVLMFAVLLILSLVSVTRLIKGVE